MSTENEAFELTGPDPEILKEIISGMIAPAAQDDLRATLLTSGEIHQRVEEHVPECFSPMDVYLALRDLKFPQVPINTRFYYRVKPL